MKINLDGFKFDTCDILHISPFYRSVSDTGAIFNFDIHFKPVDRSWKARIDVEKDKNESTTAFYDRVKEKEEQFKKCYDTLVENWSGPIKIVDLIAGSR